MASLNLETAHFAYLLQGWSQTEPYDKYIAYSLWITFTDNLVIPQGPVGPVGDTGIKVRITVFPFVGVGYIK